MIPEKRIEVTITIDARQFDNPALGVSTVREGLLPSLHRIDRDAICQIQYFDDAVSRGHTQTKLTQFLTHLRRLI